MPLQKIKESTSKMNASAAIKYQAVRLLLMQQAPKVIVSSRKLA
jgi:hypothetical protein